MSQALDSGRLSFAKFTRIVAGAVGLITLLPFFVGLSAGFTTGTTSLYQGTAVDDLMVYSAWMHQAGEGRLMFDNRFAVDDQPGLTINVYFLVLGWLGKLIGIPAALALIKPVMAVTLVLLLGRLIERLRLSRYSAKFTLGLAVWGGGVGWMGWQNFGQVAPEGSLGRSLFGAFLPIDVWQTEALTLPSMLVNGLFSASLCLTIGILLCVFAAKSSWKPVLPGALMMLVLMNIHSYDMALLGLALLGGIAAMMGRKRPDLVWIGRVFCMVLGSAPAALWFVYVLQQDKVFQARAATLTYSPLPIQAVFGLLPAIVLAVAGLWIRGRQAPIRRWGVGLLTAALALACAATLGRDPNSGFLFQWAEWLVWVAITLAGLFMIRPSMEERGIMASWAWIGLAAPYMPMLFQRKLFMGIAIPWAFLAGWGAGGWIERRTRSRRNSVSAAVLAFAGLSSLFWLQRELLFIRNNVSSTTVNAVQIRPDTVEILKRIDERPGRTVAVAFPGAPAMGEDGPLLQAPVINDLNPLLAGLAGAYAYAGHWSETPDYAERRNMAVSLFLGPPEVRAEALATIDPDVIVMPHPEALPDLTLPDPTEFGEVIYEGENYILIERKAPDPELISLSSWSLSFGR